MSVPAQRMQPVKPAGDPNKIMGLPKVAFWGIIIFGVILAFYIYKHSSSNANTSVAPTSADQGVTSADIGGTPPDNSIAQNTDLTTLEEQILQLQNAMLQFEQNQGGTAGAGIHPASSGGTPVRFGGQTALVGNQSTGGQKV